MGSVKVSAHVFVSGRVQGVFFRVETRREAMKNEVVGWVRNTSDGMVEAVFEGQRKNVRKLVDFCRRGPPAAHVKKTVVVWSAYGGEFSEFTIRKTVTV
jgi:acylphosphatase